MVMTTKERVLATLNKIVIIDDYHKDDCIFSQEYGFQPVTFVYILKQLSKDFNFMITDDFVDALENCTFAQLEILLEQYSGKAA